MTIAILAILIVVSIGISIFAGAVNLILLLFGLASLKVFLYIFTIAFVIYFITAYFHHLD